MLWEYLRLAVTLCPPLAVLGALLGWYHYESVQPVEEKGGCLRALCVTASLLPRATGHSVFYGFLILVSACLMLPLDVTSAILGTLRKEAPSSGSRPRLTAYCWTFLVFLGWPPAWPLCEDNQPTKLAELQRSLALLWPLPVLFGLFVLLASWKAEKGIPLWLWPLLTFWLGDYLLLWHVLRLHAAGRLAVGKWSPRFSLRALVLAVLAWGAWLTMLTWVWRE